MADRIIDDAILVQIADSLRTSLGTSDLITPENMSAGVGECFGRGKEAGIEEGYNNGYTAGEEAGYQNGYEAARDEVLSDPQTAVDARALVAMTGDCTTNADKIVAFAFCRAQLTGFSAPNTKSIGERAFENCMQLVTANFPSVTSSGTYSFNSCTKLKDVSFPKLKTVIGVMFYGCTAVTRFDFPSATTIDNSAFTNCKAIKQFILRANSVCNLKYSGAFTGSAIANKTCLIFVPRALIDSYKAATNWSTYADLYRAVEDITVDGTIMGELDEDKIAEVMTTL